MLKSLLSFLLPNYCPLCENKTDSINLICTKCIPEKIDSVEIKREILPDVKIYSFLPYNKVSEHLLHQIKFEEKKFFIHDIIKRLNLDFLKVLNIQLITYVPLPISRLIKRGFNQSRIIAKEVNKILNARLIRMLGKKKYEKQSLKKTKKEREEIIKNNPFYVIERMSKKISNYNSILIIDDLITTGSTIKAIIDRIKDNHNFNIKFYILTIFYTE